MLNIKKIGQSFIYAFRGLKIAAKEESFQVMLFFAILAVAFSVYFPLSTNEIVIIIVLIGTVFSMELINSQVERTLDIVRPDYDIRVKDIKDISAGAVLIASITSFIIGTIIFIPYLLSIFN